MAATAPQTPLLLDPSIRDWVVLPMVAIMVLMNLMRHYAQQAMKDSKPIDATEMQQKQLLTRAARTRTRGSRLLPSESFNARKAYFVDKDKGLLAKKPKKATKKPMDPMAMMDGMKGNMLYMAPTRRLFLTFSELQLCENGVSVVSRHRDAVDAALRESVRRVRSFATQRRCPTCS